MSNEETRLSYTAIIRHFEAGLHVDFGKVIRFSSQRRLCRNDKGYRGSTVARRYVV